MIQMNYIGLPTDEAKVEILVGYSNGAVALYNYSLNDVFGKNDAFTSQLINVVKLSKKIQPSVTPTEIISLQERSDDQSGDEEVKNLENVEAKKPEAFAKNLLHLDGADPLISIRSRLKRRDKKNLSKSNHFSKNLEECLMDDFVSIQRAQINKNSPYQLRQIASGCIGGILRIQNVVNLAYR